MMCSSINLQIQALSVHNNTDGGLVSQVSITHNTEKQNEIMDAENMRRVTHSVLNKLKSLHIN